MRHLGKGERARIRLGPTKAHQDKEKVSCSKSGNKLKAHYYRESYVRTQCTTAVFRKASLSSYLTTHSLVFTAFHRFLITGVALWATIARTY